MSGMFWIALELSIPKIGFNILLSLPVKKSDAFKFDGVAESDNTVRRWSRLSSRPAFPKPLSRNFLFPSLSSRCKSITLCLKRRRTTRYTCLPDWLSRCIDHRKFPRGRSRVHPHWQGSDPSPKGPRQVTPPPAPHANQECNITTTKKQQIPIWSPFFIEFELALRMGKGGRCSTPPSCSTPI